MGQKGSKNKKDKKTKKDKKSKNKKDDENRKATDDLNKSYNKPDDSEDEKLNEEFRRSGGSEGETGSDDDSVGKLTRDSKSKSQNDLSSQEGESFEGDSNLSAGDRSGNKGSRSGDKSKGSSRSASRDGSKSRSGDRSRDRSKDGSRDGSRSRDDSRDRSKVRSKDKSKGKSKGGGGSSDDDGPEGEQEDGYSDIDSMLRGDYEVDLEKPPTESDKVFDVRAEDLDRDKSRSREGSKSLRAPSNRSGNSSDTK